MSFVPSPSGADLRPLLRRGLPAGVIADHLLLLPGVVARATTDDRDSRAEAFNTLLRQLLARSADQRLAAAARALFGDAPGSSGQTLTQRRAHAARACGRDPDHFRKHIEPRILADLAQALAADSDRLATSQAAPPRLLPVLSPPAALPQDMFAWEAVEHEEHIARLWAGVYALRAELLACERLVSMDPAGSELSESAEAALWRAGQLHVAVRRYRRAYGARILHGGIAPDALIGLAGWSPPLDPAATEAICQTNPDAADAPAFLTQLTAGPAGANIRDNWVVALSATRTATRSAA
jgi:hypothetical protein